MSQMPVVILITTFILDSRSIFSGSGIKFEFLSKEEKKQSQQQYFAKEIPPVKLLFCSVFTNAYTNHELPGLILPEYLPVDWKIEICQFATNQFVYNEGTPYMGVYAPWFRIYPCTSEIKSSIPIKPICDWKLYVNDIFFVLDKAIFNQVLKLFSNSQKCDIGLVLYRVLAKVDFCVCPLVNCCFCCVWYQLCPCALALQRPQPDLEYLLLNILGYLSCWLFLFNVWHLLVTSIYWPVDVSAVMEALLTESLGLGKVVRGAGGRGGGCISQVKKILRIKILGNLCWLSTLNSDWKLWTITPFRAADMWLKMEEIFLLKRTLK